ncbi:MAG TPA: hypothetical protein PKI66_02660 [Methanobacteriaceae archaeon]|nr:hypothetical protein [Methanobacteriaceae archaeon]
MQICKTMSMEAETVLRLERLVNRGMYKNVSEANRAGLKLLFEAIDKGQVPLPIK